MADRADLLRIEDMATATARVLAYVEGMPFEAFRADERTVDAVLRSLAVLGETAARVTDETRALAPEIEWGRIVRSRHIIVHDYFGVDLGIVWRIVTAHLPPLSAQLAARRLAPEASGE